VLKNRRASCGQRRQRQHRRSPVCQPADRSDSADNRRRWTFKNLFGPHLLPSVGDVGSPFPGGASPCRVRKAAPPGCTCRDPAVTASARSPRPLHESEISASGSTDKRIPSPCVPYEVAAVSFRGRGSHGTRHVELAFHSRPKRSSAVLAFGANGPSFIAKRFMNNP